MIDTRIVVLAGGQGTRFWPVSRKAFPKQFLPLKVGGQSLIAETARRVGPLNSGATTYVVTGANHRELCLRHLPGSTLLCEPAPRNTAPAIAWAAAKIALENPEAVMVVLPADHAVADEAVLRSVLARAIELAAQQDKLVTIGVKPREANTGYGYLQAGTALDNDAFVVDCFHEKPDAEQARDYIARGNCYWNSGMFVWRAGVFLKAVQEHLPDLAEGVAEIVGSSGTTDEDDVLKRVFPRLPAISVDFGVMERAENTVMVVGQDFGWNDVGSWDAWSQHQELDSAGNALQGQVLLINSRGCTVYGGQRTIGLVGLDNVIVIDSEDALLVCKREAAQDVKSLVDQLKEQGRDDLL